MCNSRKAKASVIDAEPKKDNGLKEVEYLKSNGVEHEDEQEDEQEYKVAVKTSRMYRLLDHISTKELRCCAVGRALVTKETAHNMPRDELQELLEPFAYGITYDPPSIKLHPFTDPPFTYSEIVAAVPRRLYKRLWYRGFYLIAFDVAQALATFFASTFIEQSRMPLIVRCLLWTVYGYCQGMNFFALWVDTHELGHRCISEWEWVDDTINWLIASFLLVPAFSWKHDHALHHKLCGNYEDDELFGFERLAKSDSEPPIFSTGRRSFLLFLLLMLAHYTFVLINAGGAFKHPKVLKSGFFNPWAPTFTPEQRLGVAISDIGVFIMLIGLFMAVFRFGAASVLIHYVVPHLFMVPGIGILGLMQHCDPAIPAFRTCEWNWLKGTLCTVDRSFGTLLEHHVHHINDCHLTHHLFPKIPSYNFQESATYVYEVLGEYYRCDPTPLWQALLRTFFTCVYCSNNEDQNIFYMKAMYK